MAACGWSEGYWVVLSFVSRHKGTYVAVMPESIIAHYCCALTTQDFCLLLLGRDVRIATVVSTTR